MNDEEKLKLSDKMNEFSNKMLEKLCKKANNGLTGWNKKEYIEQFEIEILNHFVKYKRECASKFNDHPQDQLIDIANYCMFVHSLKSKERGNK